MPGPASRSGIIALTGFDMVAVCREDRGFREDFTGVAVPSYQHWLRADTLPMFRPMEYVRELAEYWRTGYDWRVNP